MRPLCVGLFRRPLTVGTTSVFRRCESRSARALPFVTVKGRQVTIFRLASSGIEALERTTFSNVGINERADLQRLLRDRIDVIAPDTLIVAEEFCDWEDSRRRIDLLGVDHDANIVVIELKRTEGGGHMDLQAIRYGAMVSTLTFGQIEAIFGRYLAAQGRGEEDPRELLLEWFDWETAGEKEFAQDVRIVLASGEFSIEITTAVLWLNSQGLDICCVRLEPYRYREEILLDVQQVVPLPEAAEYQVRVREKEQRERAQRQADATRYDVAIGRKVFGSQPKRRAIYQLVRHLIDNGVTPERIREIIDWRRKLFREVEGEVGSEELVARLKSAAAEGGPTFDPHRYFCDDDEIFHVNGRTYALAKQWGVRAVEAMNRLAAAFPEQEITIQPVER